MKQRIIHIHIEDDDAFFGRAKAAFKNVQIGNRSKDGEHLSFATYEQFTSAFSEKRYALLRRLKALGPISIRALSKDLERDYKSVHGDVQKLI